MMRRILGRALTAIFSDEWFTTPHMWVPPMHCLQQWPRVRPGKSGVAAARRAARKARNKRRARRA